MTMIKIPLLPTLLLLLFFVLTTPIHAAETEKVEEKPLTENDSHKKEMSEDEDPELLKTNKIEEINTEKEEIEEPKEEEEEEEPDC